MLIITKRIPITALRIIPTKLGSYVELYFNAHFDGYLDSWRLDLTYPLEPVMRVMNMSRRPDMNIPYVKSDGTEDIYEADLSIAPKSNNQSYNGGVILSSSTNQYGYWDYNHDGSYEPYGTIKWGAGGYDDFFRIDYLLLADCTGDSIIIDGYLSSSYDTRGYYIAAAYFYKVIYLKVAYLLGDVNGDDVVSIGDVTALISYVLTHGDWFDQYQFDAADINHDGAINISDVTALSSIVTNNGTASLEDINEALQNIYDM